MIVAPAYDGTTADAPISRRLRPTELSLRQQARTDAVATRLETRLGARPAPHQRSSQKRGPVEFAGAASAAQVFGSVLNP
jgi:hypothetical protein